MRIIEILTGSKDKEKVWLELGKRYKANILKIIKEGDRFPDESECVAKYGYILVWNVEEDDIHVFGDGNGEITQTIIQLDNALNYPESIEKLELAIKCLHYIEANRKKYYHKTGKDMVRVEKTTWQGQGENKLLYEGEIGKS